MKKLSIFRILVLFSFIYGVNSTELTSEQKEEIFKQLNSHWEPVNTYKVPLGFETVFSELDPSLWPILPESHKWCILEDGETIQLFKHKLTSDHRFDFVTYFTDSLNHFNFLSRWDDVTYQSFAYARHNSPLTDENGREVFPMDKFSHNGKALMCGHCIDYMDTYGLSELSKIKSGTFIESISTLDDRNYVPEPLDSYWWKYVKTGCVEKIRAQGGCYAQYMAYFGQTAEITGVINE